MDQLPQSVSASIVQLAPRARVAAFALGAAILAIIVVHLETAMSLAAIWRRSETFAHGWLVAPLALWLAWQNRAALSAIPVESCYFGLAAIALAGFGWLLADLASVAIVAQFALVFMIQAAVLTVLGWPAAKMLAFPLAFLLFAVPAGEFMVPKLMQWTADVTTDALRLSGIPVYREGNDFILPTGAWSVVEACSGIRYLMASLMTGTLYAYLAYRSLHRRLIFVGVSLVVPLVANWARAYFIVMLGHLSDGRLAAGVDHLIYGWVFFGVIIALMFWIGSFWREDVPPEIAPATRPVLPMGAAEIRTLFAALSAVIAAWIWPITAAALKPEPTSASVQLAPIAAEAGWSSRKAQPLSWSPYYIGARSHLRGTFDKPGRGTVDMYIAFYRDQTDGIELVSSANVLVRAADREWRERPRSGQRLSWAGTAVEARSSEVIGRDQRILVRRLYWSDGRVTANDYYAKAMLAFAKLIGAGDASAAVVLYTDAGDSLVDAEARLDAFAAEMSTAIDRALTAAAERK